MVPTPRYHHHCADSADRLAKQGLVAPRSTVASQAAPAPAIAVTCGTCVTAAVTEAGDRVNMLALYIRARVSEV